MDTRDSLDDLAWLRSRTTLTLLGAELSSADVRERLAATEGCSTAVVHPTHIGLVPEGVVRAVAVGYPTGRHHSLIKASEARLAVEFGAEEVWLSVDSLIDDPNSLLADVVAVRQAVPQPVRLVVPAADERIAGIARDAGADAVVVDKRPTGAGEGDIVAVDDLEEAVAALEDGATRIATAHPHWLTG